MKAILYVGWGRETEVEIEVNKCDSELGFTYIKCLECDGSGVWDFIEYIPSDKCVDCKGTGKVLINV